MIAVVTDSCASVPVPIAEGLGIEVVPYFIHSVLGTHRDGVDMPPDEFYAWVRSAPEWPATANPSSGEYLEALRRISRHSDGAVMISMTSKGSGGFLSATLAKRLAEAELPGFPVEVVDTHSVGMAHGWSVIQAARAARKGALLEEVTTVARHTAEKAFLAFTNDTLEYLERGGRIGRVTRVVGGALSIKPIIGMRNGMPSPLSVARTRHAAYKRIVGLALNHIPSGSVIRAALMHVAASDEVEVFRPLLEAHYAVIEWIVAQLSPALGVHSGPGTVGISIIPETLSP